MNVISFSLFGFNKDRQKDCFDFHSYLRGLMINLRLARLLFPDWRVRLHIDQVSYDAFERLFELLSGDEWSNIIDIVICDEAPLTKSMLWRLKPAFDPNVERFICRDLDSPLTYRDAQAVQDWIESGKAAHAITDSVSHNINMLGGMVGFTKYFMDKVGVRDWDSLVNQMGGYDRKGADQDLLNTFVYPHFAVKGTDSIKQHYVLGMPNSFLDGWTNEIPDVEVPGVHHYHKQSDDICGHIGAAGYYEPPLFKYLNKYWDSFDDISSIEKHYPKNLFFWNFREDLIQTV